MVKKHRYEIYMSTLGWTLVDLKKGEEWKIDDYCGNTILKNSSYGEKAFKNKCVKSIPIPKTLANELFQHRVKLIMKFDPNEE